jgi:hypothetical protein
MVVVAEEEELIPVVAVMEVAEETTAVMAVALAVPSRHLLRRVIRGHVCVLKSSRERTFMVCQGFTTMGP